MSQISREAGTARRHSSKSLRRRRMQRTSPHDHWHINDLVDVHPRSSSNNLVQELHRWNLWISSRRGALIVDELDLRHLHFGLDPCEQLDAARTTPPT